MQETMQKSTPGTNLSIQQNQRTKLAQRNNTIQLMALIHHQFCSPRFVDTCKYAWYKAGYIPQRPPKFQTPLQYSFGHALGVMKAFLFVVPGVHFCIVSCIFGKMFLCVKHLIDSLVHVFQLPIESGFSLTNVVFC